MPQVGLIIFLTCSVIFSLEAKQNYWFPATGFPVEVKRTVVLPETKQNSWFPGTGLPIEVKRKVFQVLKQIPVLFYHTNTNNVTQCMRKL
jgi:hypothetical protein